MTVGWMRTRMEEYHHAGISRLIQAAIPFTWFSPPEYKPRGDIVGLLGVLLPAMAASKDGPPHSSPPHKYLPSQARRWMYRCDEEPHAARVPRKPRLRTRRTNPLTIYGNVEEMCAITPLRLFCLTFAYLFHILPSLFSFDTKTSLRQRFN